MARVLYTRQARLRLVVAVLFVLGAPLMVRGWFVVATQSPDAAVWYDYIAAMIALFATIFAIGLGTFALGDQLVVEPINRWINNGE